MSLISVYQGILFRLTVDVLKKRNDSTSDAPRPSLSEVLACVPFAGDGRNNWLAVFPVSRLNNHAYEHFVLI